MPEQTHSKEPDLAGDAPANEQRSAPRLPPGRIAVACLASSESTAPAAGRVLDVSAGGLGLRTKAHFEAGVLLLIELIGTAPVVVRVAHATPVDAGRWLIGCSLLEPLPDDFLRKLTR